MLTQDVAILNILRSMYKDIHDGCITTNGIKRDIEVIIEVLKTRQLPDSHPAKIKAAEHYQKARGFIMNHV